MRPPRPPRPHPPSAAEPQGGKLMLCTTISSHGALADALESATRLRALVTQLGATVKPSPSGVAAVRARSATLRVSGAQKGSPATTNRIARRRVHAALDTTIIGSGSCRVSTRALPPRSPLSLRRCRRRRRGPACRPACGTPRRTATLRVCASSDAALSPAIGRDEHQDQQKNLSHDRSHHRTVQTAPGNETAADIRQQ